MTTLLTIALVVVVAGAISGATMTAFRRERRSIAKYKQMMNVMEDLSANGPLNSTSPRSNAETTRSHVRKIGSHSTQVTNGAKPRPSGAEVNPRELIRDLVRPDEPIETQKPRIGSASPSGHLRISPRDDLVDNEATLAMPRLKVTVDRPEEVSPGSGNTDGRPESASGTSTPGYARSQLETIPTVPIRFVVTALLVIVVLGVGVVGYERFSGTSNVVKLPTTTTTNAAKATTTTQPPTITPQSQSGQNASFTVPAGNNTYVLSVSAPCWVEYSTTPYGTILWDAVIQPGSNKTITAAGPIWMRAGNSTALHITVNSTSVAITTPSGPFNYTFTPAG